MDVEYTGMSEHLLLASKSDALWEKIPEVPKQKMENMSIFLASRTYLMVIIDNSSFFVIKYCTFNVL